MAKIKLYKHLGNGRTYQIIMEEEFADFSVKQSSEDRWENIVAYQDVETLQPFITGTKRFKEKFKELE